MSAFVMSERFFNELASELYAHATLKHSKLKWAVEYSLGLRDVPENRAVQHLQQFVQDCYTLNVESVNYCYKQSDPAPQLRFTPASGLTKWSDEQLMKYLECLSYQCAEGDCEQDARYQKLEALIGHVARAIVGQSEEYEIAYWDYRG